MKTVFYNARVITPVRMLQGGVETENGVITRVFEGQAFDTRADLVIDCQGNYVSPGFIDTHIHGAGGADFMDATQASIDKITTISANHGTTALLATTLTATRERIENALRAISESMEQPRTGAAIVGVHLEGNYFSMEQRGAQNPAYIYPPREEEYGTYVKLAKVRMITAAPEIEGALELARFMQQRNVCVSIGHSSAKYEQILAGIEAGFTHSTHTYNGMSYYSNTNYYPEMGTCESVLLRDEITTEVIADGKHVSPPMLQLMYKIKGAEHMHAVTDAVMADMPEGDYNLGGLDTMVTDGVCMLRDRTSFAGSIATTDRLLRVLVYQAHIPICDAVKMLTSTPARVIGLQASKGRIAAGYDADLNVFDENINIKAIMIMGEMYKNEL